MSETPWLILDLDNCLADDAWRRHHLANRDFDSYHLLCGFDRMVNRELLLPEHRIAIFTGRPEKVRVITEHWLRSNGIDVQALYMRIGDHQSAVPMKRAMLARFGSAYPDAIIACAYDDREDIVAMYRSKGLCAEIARADGVDSSKAAWFAELRRALEALGAAYTAPSEALWLERESTIDWEHGLLPQDSALRVWNEHHR